MRDTESEIEAAIAEIRKTKETANRIANADYTDDVDHTRVLAGLVKQLAEQVERLASPPGIGRDAGDTAAEDPARPEEGLKLRS